MEGVNLWQIVISIVLTIIGFLIGIIGFLLKGLKSSVDERLNNQDNRIEKVSNQIAELKANLPHIYVLRDDFLRAISGIDTRIELEFKEISKQFQEFWRREAEKGRKDG